MVARYRVSRELNVKITEDAVYIIRPFESLHVRDELHG